MSEPIVMISNLRIKEGHVGEYKQFTQEVTEWIEANRPGTAAILEYLSEDETELSIVIVFSGAEAMQAHIQGLGEFPDKSREYAEVESIQIYGKPNEATLKTMRMIADAGLAIKITPQWIGGFTRLSSD